MIGMRWKLSCLYTWCLCKSRHIYDRDRTYSRIPHSDLQWTALDRLEQDRHGPLPFLHDAEELKDDSGGGGFWVQLADSSDEHGPSYATRETHNIGVDSTSLCPELDT